MFTHLDPSLPVSHIFFFPQEYCINDFDLVRLVRAVREREALHVAKRLRPGAPRPSDREDSNLEPDHEI